MDVQYSSTDSYPLNKKATVGNEVYNLGIGETPLARIQDFITATVGYDAQGNFNKNSDPFLADVMKLIFQSSTAEAGLALIATGTLPPSDAEPQYAGGIISEGNRLFTAPEVAANTLNTIKMVS